MMTSEEVYVLHKEAEVGLRWMSWMGVGGFVALD